MIKMMVRLLAVWLSSLALLSRASEQSSADREESKTGEIVNGKCSRLLEQSLKTGSMASLGEEFMNGFTDLMADSMKILQRDHHLKTQEDQLASMVNTGLQAASSTGGSSSSSVSAKDLTGEPEKKKQQAVQGKKGLPRPDPGMVYTSAGNSKALFGKLIQDLDPTSIGLRVIPDSTVRYFTIPKGTDGTARRIIFFAPQIPDYDPLALGKSLVAQRLRIHKLSTEVKDKVKAFLLENQENNAQIVFTGYASGAAVAQLAAIKLNFDYELTLYRNRHRVISVGFGDVRIFSPQFINAVDTNGFDHRDHLTFCSTEEYLPVMQAQRGTINYVGKRVVFGLDALLMSKMEEDFSMSVLDLNSAVIMSQQNNHHNSPLTKYLTWATFKSLSLPAFEAYETSAKEDKSVQIPKAIEALQNHFKACRLSQHPHIFVDCIQDVHGEELDQTIPSSRLICTVKDTNSKAEIQFYYRLYWTDDEHDINEKFLSSLRAARQDANKYVVPAVKKNASNTKGLKLKGKNNESFRNKFVNWALFFQSQLSDSPSPLELASRIINPFFDQSTFFLLDSGKFKYSLNLSSEVLLRKLLSTDAADQRLIRVLFGPLDAKLPYRDLSKASQLFKAPSSPLSEQTASLAALIKEMLGSQVTRPTLSELVNIDKEKVWGDFVITKMESTHMDRFSSDAILSDLAEVISQPSKSKDCSHSLPAKHCPRMTLLEIASPFWQRMYRHNDVYVAFRGSSLAYTMQSTVQKFCQDIRGREYKSVGSSIVFEVRSLSKSYGNGYLPQYTFYLMVIQDPK